MSLCFPDVTPRRRISLLHVISHRRWAARLKPFYTPCLESDKGTSERALGPITIGTDNWMFLGNNHDDSASEQIKGKEYFKAYLLSSKRIMLSGDIQTGGLFDWKNKEVGKEGTNFDTACRIKISVSR